MHAKIEQGHGKNKRNNRFKTLSLFSIIHHRLSKKIKRKRTIRRWERGIHTLRNMKESVRAKGNHETSRKMRLPNYQQ
uniref:Uncharacterized protein n=1 Tax=Manihot esculenta TaxID=3983 RepID=A0A2C9VVT8_MANES